MEFEPCNFFSGMACGAVIINCIVQIIKINREYNSKLKSFDEHWEEIQKDLKSDKEQFKK